MVKPLAMPRLAYGRARRARGFSLVELTVAVALMSIIVLYLVQSFTVQQRTYVMVDQVTEAQQNLRAISDLIEREVRLAGFMVDEGGAVCGLDQTAAADTLFVSDASALDPTTAIQPALGARLAAGSVPAAGNTLLTLGSGDTVTLDAQPAYDTDGNSINDSDFQVNGGVIVYDRNAPSRGSACGIVTAIPATTQIRVNFLASTLSGAAAGAQLVAVPAHVYQVSGTAQLLRDGRVVAEDVEDLQVAYFFDEDSDQVVDVNEDRGITGQPYVASAQDNSELRQIRLNFVVRTRGTDPGFTAGQFQTTENRVAPAAGAADPQLRRRVHTTTVRVRNVGNRGLLG